MSLASGELEASDESDPSNELEALDEQETSDNCMGSRDVDSVKDAVVEWVDDLGVLAVGPCSVEGTVYRLACVQQLARLQTAAAAVPVVVVMVFVVGTYLMDAVPYC